jgi:parvulin-like peptidyl-prolyl isomerase
VGSLRIPRAELDQRVQLAVHEYRQRSGAELPDELRVLLERQLLETLIRGRLLVLEAQRQKVFGTDAEAEAELRRDPFFQENGRFSEARFQMVKTQDPARWQVAIDQIKAQLGALRLNQQLERKNVPAEAELRGAAERELARAAVDALPLTLRDFDGGYDEPREAEVRARYLQEREGLRRPARARVSVVYVDRPALPDTLATVEQEVRAWEARLRPRADSALAMIRSGASIDSVGALYGGVRRNVELVQGGMPDFWAGDARDEAAVFSAAPGTLLSEPVRARPGWLVVRVESREPSRVPTLAEAAREIRSRLRAEARQFGDERRLRALYATRRDSLAGPGVKVRWAVFDPATVRMREPSGAELDRYYRGHIADYSGFDSRRGVVLVRPLAEVRAEVRERWKAERRAEVARETGERLYRSWSRGRRDASAERAAGGVREAGPVPLGAPPDTGAAAALLGDSLAARGAVRGAGFGRWADGVLVWDVLAIESQVVPTFEQARPRLAAELAKARAKDEEEGAHALWEAEPQRFAGGDVVHVGRLLVPLVQPMDVPLTREEVERWHREHLDQYAASEMVTARHILITPRGEGPEADSAARQRAVEIRARLRAGEPFEELARRHSDDQATRERGGDLGTFGRGAMLPDFERAAFAMQKGQISEPIRTEVGWDIIECLDHLPLDAEPLVHVYTNVASDAAAEKAEQITRQRADSLMVRLRTPADARAAARRMGLDIYPLQLRLGDPVLLPDQVAYIRRLERTAPGTLYPAVHQLKGQGYVISWVDSVTPAPPPSWEDARPRALDAYRAGAARRALQAKRAELDSLLAAGMSLDSLAATFGGLHRIPEMAPMGNLAGLGRSSQVDSLLFGRSRPAVLEPGQISDWIDLGTGIARVRLVERLTPPASQVTARVESQRRASLERAMRGYFDGLRKRHPVRILDARLRDVNLPEPPG